VEKNSKMSQENNKHFYFESNEIEAEYRIYARSLFSFQSVIPISVYYTVYVICNYNVANIFGPEIYSQVIYHLIVLGYLTFLVFLYCEAMKRIFDHNSKSSFLKLSEWIESSSFGKHKENIISVVYSALAGIVLYARVCSGDCDHIRTFWEVQSCNPGANCGMIPPDQVIICYATPVLAQLSLRAVSYPYSVLSWAITVSFVVVSILKVGSWNDFWLIPTSVIFLHIICEFERGFRSTFRLAKETVDIYRKQEKLQGELNLSALENERTLHDKTVLEIQSHKDKELSTSIGIQLRSLIGNVAHDLKTPLQAIGLGVEEIRERAFQIHQESDLDEMDDKADHQLLEFSSVSIQEKVEFIFEATTTIAATVAFMSMIINRAIDFTKASHEIRLIPTYETIDLEEALAWPVRIMSALQRRIDVIVEPLPVSINRFIISDKGWLSENLLCLLSNAIKYSNEGCTTIRCSLKEVTSTSEKTATISSTADANDKQKVFQVEVEDSGIGISPEMRTRLFTSFQQAQRMAGGTGLGLYSMKKRMESLKGECGVRNRDDGKQGSCFWFHFPYRPDPLAAAHSSPLKDATPSPSSSSSEGFFASDHSHRDVSSQPPKAGSHPSLGPLRLQKAPNNSRKGTILVVDDSMPILKMTSLSLTREGFSVTTAVNGSEALKHLLPTPNPFSLVLMDLQMPVMDGLEAVRRLRAFEAAEEAAGRQRSRLPVIAMSANDDEATASIVLSSGFDHFIPKPFSLNRFREACAAVLPDE